MIEGRKDLDVSGRCTAFLAGLLFASHLSADPTPPPRRVVILSGTDVMLPASLIQDSIVRQVLSPPGGTEAIEFYSEALDAFRLPSEEYEPELVSFLERKYRKRPPDLVIAITELSLRFLERYRDKLWPQTPVVFSSVNRFSFEKHPVTPWATGILEDVDPEGTIRLARILQPRARRVLLVAGATDRDAAVVRDVRERLERWQPPLEIQVRTDVTPPRFREEFGRLDMSTILIYISMFRDASGRVTVPREMGRLLSSATSVPTYGLYSTFEGNGMIGGSLIDFEAEGRALAGIARRVLDGVPAASIPVESPRFFSVVDAGVLARFRIPESRVPPGTTIRNRTPTAWELYRWRIVAIAFAIAVETALLVALLAQRRARRSSDEESRRRRQELAHAARLTVVGELTASIAHEINQPLGAILANVKAAEMILASAPPPNPELQEVLADIRADDLRASNVIRHVRSLAVNRAMEMEPVDMNALAEEVCHLLRAEAGRRGVSPELDLAENLPSVRGDRVCLEQVLMNLVLNAMDALEQMPADRRHVVIQSRKDESARVMMRVRDTGPGISPEALPRLFDSFFTTKQQGMGLGLSICRTIVEAHGGSIRAENDPSGGATFQVTVPGIA